MFSSRAVTRGIEVSVQSSYVPSNPSRTRSSGSSPTASASTTAATRPCSSLTPALGDHRRQRQDRGGARARAWSASSRRSSPARPSSTPRRVRSGRRSARCTAPTRCSRAAARSSTPRSRRSRSPRRTPCTERRAGRRVTDSRARLAIQSSMSPLAERIGDEGRERRHLTARRGGRPGATGPNPRRCPGRTMRASATPRSPACGIGVAEPARRERRCRRGGRSPSAPYRPAGDNARSSPADSCGRAPRAARSASRGIGEARRDSPGAPAGSRRRGRRARARAADCRRRRRSRGCGSAARSASPSVPPAAAVWQRTQSAAARNSTCVCSVEPAGSLTGNVVGRRRIEQVGLGLRVVPLVGVAVPAVGAADEEAGLERAARGGIAALDLVGELLHEDGAVGQVPGARSS